MRCAKTPRIAASGLVLAAVSLAVPANATTPVPSGSRPIVVAQAMIPRTGMMDAQNPMPMKERYLKRFPQPARVGDLLGMPVLDLYSKNLGWFGRPVAVPLERSVLKVGIWCRSICHPVNMLLHRPGMTRAQHLCQWVQQCASRCPAANKAGNCCRGDEHYLH